MKQPIIYTLTAMIVVFLMSTLTVHAQERYKKIEMADGNYVLFKMTPEEIASEYAQKARRAELKRSIDKAPEKWTAKIEMPESGNVIEFPLSAEQIQSAKQEKRENGAQVAQTKLAAEDKANVIEMADGQTIMFYTN